MNQSFYIVDLNIPYQPERHAEHDGYHRKPENMGKDELFFLHGNGCKRWQNCLTCPFPDCDWQPYTKWDKRGETNES